MRKFSISAIFTMSSAMLAVAACGGDGDDATPQPPGGAATGGLTGSGGASSGGAATGGALTGGASSGGATTGGLGGTGGSGAATGGLATGGLATGGAPSGGALTGGVGTGGADTGGTGTGGAPTGGVATGGAPTGGTGIGGLATGGLATGGLTTTGGAVTGGAPTGGVGTGGAGTGGATTAARCAGGTASGRTMECLARGVIATHQGGGSVFVSWRYFGTDPADIAFNLYRQGGSDAPLKLNASPLTGATNYQDEGANLSQATTYCVRAVLGGVEQAQDAEDCHALAANPPERSYLAIPLQPADPAAYVHLAWVGDLDGDGEYDFVVNRIGGLRPLVEAYRRDGTFLWRLDTGPNGENQNNIEGGASTMSNGMWDGMTVFDLEGDGKAEIAIKTAPGVVFGDGETLPGSGETQTLSILEGTTGRELARIPMPTDYLTDGPLQCQFGVGYFDGSLPSVVAKCKNRVGSGAFNLVSAAYDYRGGQLVERWKYLRNQSGAADYHQIRLVDVDGDGRDELADGGYVVDDDGEYLYGIPGAIHGDRFHIGDLDPDRPGLEGFGIQQDNASGLLFYYYDARTGEVLRAHTGAVADMARGTAADIDPTRRGYEYWTFGGTFNVQELSTGPLVADPNTPWPNFRIWWDGDAASELLNQNWVGKWNYQSPGRNSYVFRTSLDGLHSWRDAVPFYGDVLGDWREEILMESPDHTELRLFSSTYATELRLYTLVHNPEYRNCLTVHGYRQSTMVDYYLGDGMDLPPQPAIHLASRR